MKFAKKISRQTNIDCILWLLVIALMKTYNEKEQAGQRKIQNVQFIKRLKKSMMLSGIKGVAISVQDLSLISFQLVKKI